MPILPPESGSGGGGSVESSNVISITKESDFPTQDGTSITLESSYIYDIRSPVTTAKYFKCEGGSVSATATDVPFLTYTGTGYMFDIDESIIRINGITASCPNATFLRIIGDGTLTLAYRASLEGVAVTNCTGVFRSELGGVISAQECNFVGTFSGSTISFSDSVLLASLSRVAIIGLTTTGIGIDLGTAVFSEGEFENVVMLGDPSATAINGLTDSANVISGGEISVDGCNFAAFTTPLTGIEENDIRLQFGSSNSPNVKKSQNAGDIYLDGAAQTIVVAQDEWHEIGTPVGATWEGDITDRFVVNPAGYLVYVGERPIDIRLTARATIEKIGGGQDELECRIAKNWSGLTTDGGLAKSRASTKNSQPTSVPMGALTLAETNDNFRVIFNNLEGASNISATVTSLEVRG